MNFRDGQVAIHRAVAGNQNFVLHAANVNLVAIHHLRDIPTASEFRKSCTAARKILAYSSAPGMRDSQRLDVNVDARAGIGRLPDILLRARVAWRCASRRLDAFVHLQVQFDEKMPVVLVRGEFVDRRGRGAARWRESFQRECSFVRARGST